MVEGAGALNGVEADVAAEDIAVVVEEGGRGRPSIRS